MDDGASDFVECPRCGARVNVGDIPRPLITRDRPANDHDEASYLMMGRDRLLHRCELPARG